MAVAELEPSVDPRHDSIPKVEEAAVLLTIIIMHSAQTAHIISCNKRVVLIEQNKNG